MLKKTVILFILSIITPCFAISGGDIQITCEPDVRIWLNDEFKGKTTYNENGLFIENIAPGKYTLKAAKSGYKLETRTVEVKPGITAEVKVSFTTADIQTEDLTQKEPFEIARQYGILILRSAPMGAAIYLDGERVGKTDTRLNNIPAGEHRLKFVFKNETLEDTYLVSPNQILKLKAHFKENRIINEYDKDFTNAIGMKFVFIPPGLFKMRHSQEPGTPVSGFYMQITEVTQEQWLKIMKRNPSSFNRCGNKCPVEKVSRNDILQFIKNLNKYENTDTYRLPTQIEWEYACRAGKDTKYCFGDDIRQIDEYGWYKENSDEQTHPAGSRKPNTWGLYDMHGNVSEMCEDLQGGSDPVCRGGDYLDEPEYLSCFLQEIVPIVTFRSTIGFRLVKTP